MGRGRGPPAEGVGKALDRTVFVLGSEERLRWRWRWGKRAEWKGLPSRGSGKLRRKVRLVRGSSAREF